MDTYLYDLSIPAISSLQVKLANTADLMSTLSTVFDPKYAFLIYSPLVYLLNPRVGRKLIMTLVLAEWLNMILKWLLHGERPYWYVHSSGHFDPQQVPIKQFPMTCELGPGHPSGHAMVTASVWYIILDSALSLHRERTLVSCGQAQDGSELAKVAPKSRQASNGTLRTCTWLLYGSIILLVSVSRVFLGCHFPHQCVAGATLGHLLARWVSSKETRASHFVAASGVLLASALATFGLLQLLGLDPGWTIELATRHCESRDYIHLDTAPFFSIMRYCGFALGTGLGLLLPLHRQLPPPHSAAAPAAAADKGQWALTWLAPRLLMAVLMARLVDRLSVFVTHSNLAAFYSSAFLAYALFAYAFINISVGAGERRAFSWPLVVG